ncbi:hypothetical protein M8J75_005801 [Diaphorina citri]|nr:hypothetical protein M8J75_005801 [Diaphorina citri]
MLGSVFQVRTLIKVLILLFAIKQIESVWDSSQTDVTGEHNSYTNMDTSKPIKERKTLKKEFNGSISASI